MTNSRSFHWDIVAPAMIFDFWIRLHVRGPPSRKKTNQYLLMECFWIAFEQGSDGPYVFKPSVGEAHQEKCGHIHILLPLRINIQNPLCWLSLEVVIFLKPTSWRRHLEGWDLPFLGGQVRHIFQGHVFAVSHLRSVDMKTPRRLLQLEPEVMMVWFRCFSGFPRGCILKFQPFNLPGCTCRQAQDVLEQRSDVETSGSGKLKLRLEELVGWKKENLGKHKPKALHPWKLTSPLKSDHFSREYIFQPSIFRGHVSFQGSK